MRSDKISYRLGAGVVLLASLVLRVVLAARGGQWWWYDESRFRASLDCVHDIATGRPSVGLHLLFSSFDHIGFKLLGLIPAVGVEAGLPIWMAAAFFGAFSVGTLWLIWRVAFAATKDEATAFWALAVAAGSASLFYFDRFLFPYDPAMFFGFGALLVVGDGEHRGRVFLAGVMAGAGFLIYNGYWLFCGVTMCVALDSRPRGWRPLLERAAIGAIGFSTPILVCVATGYLTGADPIRSMRMFSETVTQGAFREGWTFPFDYFWHTEGLLLVLWLAALLWFVRSSFRSRRPPVRWSAAVLAIYLGLAAGSAVLHRFVEYGRIVRCLVPYLSLISGVGVAAIIARSRHRQLAVAACASALAIVGVVHVMPPLMQWFPDPFFARARDLAWSAAAQQRVLIRNAHGIRVPEQADPVFPGRILFSRPHPIAYDPFLFEGYTPELRAKFRATDTTMQVVLPSTSELPPTLPQLPRPPGPLRIVLRLPAGNAHRRLPIIVTGCGQQSDLFTIIRQSANRFQFADYHWSKLDSVSRAITLDEATTHVIDVSLGSLVPPNATGGAARLAHWLYVAVDGQVLFNQSQPFYATRPVDIDIGRCLIGGGEATAEVYPAEIKSVSQLPASVILDHMPNGG